MAAPGAARLLNGFFLLLITLTAGFAPPTAAQVYQIQHCYLGCPTGADANNHLLVRSIYALSYNSELKTAEWVAYEVDAGAIGIASSLSRRPMADDYAIETLTSADFMTSDSTGYIRAQYVPLVSFAATPYWDEVNYLSNAVARTNSLSQGAWYGLDWAIRNLVNREGAVFVVTGPTFNSEAEPRLLNTARAHRVPDGFYKVVVDQEGRAAAFLLGQDTPVHVHHCELVTSIEEIEALTSLDLFPGAKTPLSLSLQSSLGCN
ncbi:MAG: DNA/RNA non-specific endonuclease [Pseudomonadales bacterium]|nr:DNA/RNA non-specific endonuclease [Pseudomonadales bacterium]